MSDVFISYSRRDREFVRTLFDGLEARQRDVWVDWSDIDYGADWWQMICDGIDAADSFVFVITPDSVASDVCYAEIEYAAAQNKRIIPILYRDVTDAALKARMHTAVQRHNWVPFTNEDAFQASVDALLETVDKEPEHVDAHTRLLVRAREWDGRGRNRSLLLRGDDLSRAEGWLTAAVDKTPEPTRLHAEYIAASRAQARRSGRLLLAGVSLGLVITLIAAVIALIQSDVAAREADSRATQQAIAEEALATSQARGTSVAVERDRADSNAALAATNEAQALEQAEVALSRQLAAQSIALRAGNLDIALLLGLEGIRLRDDNETRSGFLTAISTAPNLTRYLRGHEGSVRSLAFSPDGTRLMTGGGGGQVLRWELGDGRPFGQPINMSFAVTALHFTDNDTVLVSTSDGAVSRMAFETGNVVENVRQTPADVRTLVQDAVVGARFSADGRWLALLTREGDRLGVYDMQDGRLLGQQTISETYKAEATLFPGTFDLSADAGGVVLVIDGVIWRWNPVTGERTRLNTTQDTLASIASAPDGTLLAWTDISPAFQKQFVVWDTVASEAVRTFTLSDVGTLPNVAPLAFDPTGSTLYAVTSEGTLMGWNLVTGEPTMQPYRGHNEAAAALSVGDGWAVTADDAGTVALWQTGRTVAHPLVEAIAPEPALAVDLTRDEARMATLQASGIVIHSRTDNTPIHQPINPEGNLFEVKIHPDGETVAAIIDGARVAMWDISGEASVQVLDETQERVQALAYSPNGRFLASVDLNDVIRIWDARTGEQLSLRNVDVAPDVSDPTSLTLPTTSSVLAFSPDSEMLAVAGAFFSGPNDVRMWQVTEDGELSQETAASFSVVEEGVTGTFDHLRFSPDGRLLMAASAFGRLYVWDMAAERPALQPLLAPEETVLTDVDFSPDGRTLAASQRSGVQLWDVASGRTVGEPIAMPGTQSIAFTSDGLLTGGADGLQHIPLDMTRWRAAACHRANRNLAEDEWNRFVGEQPYHLSCPEVTLAEAERLLLDYAPDDPPEADRVAAVEMLAQVVESVRRDDAAALADLTCRHGALLLQAETVMPACDHAVTLAPENAPYRESRALARALNGDLSGARDDLTQIDAADGSQVAEWSAALAEGDNPFDLTTRRALRAELTGSAPAAVPAGETVRMLPDEVPPPEAMLTAQEYAQAVAEANLPYTPLGRAGMLADVPGYTLAAVERIDRESLGTFAGMMAPGPDAFGMRIEVEDGVPGAYAGIFQSNGGYTDVSAWADDTVLRLGSETESKTLDGVDVMEFHNDETVTYLAIVDGVHLHLTSRSISRDDVQAIMTALLLSRHESGTGE